VKFPFEVTISKRSLRTLVSSALREDIGKGDLTTTGTVGRTARAEARLRLKQDGVVAGLRVFEYVFKVYDPQVRIALNCNEGRRYKQGRTLAEIKGRARSILTCERVALNLLQHLSGIATLTHRFVQAVEGTGVRIVDTRKTTPGLRQIEKYAVLAGGGFNHRVSLSDLVLIKDNHIRAAGGIPQAVAILRKSGVKVPVEVEVSPDVDLDQIRNLDVDIIMLDNWPLARLRRAIRTVRAFPSKPLIEVSGNISLNNVRRTAGCRPDFISVGCITHSAPALDISLDFKTGSRHAGS
jgi:nicotinate-nucleotide pyrophosphorylase (carboxylating)